ncbi:putative prophage encoded two-component system histidine kinase [Pseudomonas syringae pv. actinidiae ICMP 18804]|uniref:histidine kinase n=2 Tax=Pseudomonas syringae TaxID=317 RepID=A0A656JSM2_PSESF|nr:ATP-binding protein [Pseudomonas syringae]EPN49439.1 putative prophage encoded two-component system histidine kinase [Pseudomonas syringae pv. actinidiae ICMP 19096]EPM48913.1 putative prophage encoded two-component system histidine kinase [Pseudomonas syringae pv. actinidiae ICMP 19098]EPM84823.1 putative prophage encoded two-component system histidine kinase [Pseudomonas syringae pv. actinidiae ICMP 18804]EPN19610.1 putative prophage encoded two-component system histidine kinase [Pseudomon
MQTLNFRVSSHLKSIIGRDLITDDFVAIFELVKNSFDAGASEVLLQFSNDCLFIIDNGKGMSYDDLINKWLFVAYSAKQDGSEDDDSLNYRESIASKRYAGSKGVGRFSCDRIGELLFLQTRKRDAAVVNRLEVVWSDFEASAKDDFVNIDIKHTNSAGFDLPSGVVFPYENGTILEIGFLRSDWGRSKLKELKSSLAKLINPFGAQKENFSVIIAAEKEILEDERIIAESEEVHPNEIVNGPVDNFIFQALQEKTTWLRTYIKDDRIISELTDRGKVVYKISEENLFLDLNSSSFECDIFYLNRSAKSTFARRMGVSSVAFGSVFLFKNGFRVYPIGEPGDDSFAIDRRKQQGYSRYLGTRDVLGKIEVFGDDSNFKESSSRDKGLIETAAYLQLHEVFWKKCFQRLENYVVGVNWRIKYDSDLQDSHHLGRDEVRSRIIDVINKLSNSPGVQIDYFADDLLTIIDSKTKDFDSTIENLSSIAEKLGDKKLLDETKVAQARYHEMLRAEAEAIQYAEAERAERHKAEALVLKTEKALKTEVDRNLFLTSLQSHDKDVLESLHHQVIIYASNAINLIEASLFTMNSSTLLSRDDLQETFETLLLLNQQVIAASRFATKANFKIDSNTITTNFAAYLEQYVEKICKVYKSKVLITVSRSAKDFNMQFKPIEISIIIDNLIDNSIKARATKVNIDISKLQNNALRILVSDDGVGLSDEIDDSDSIFEKGITTTSGSGLGLYNVRQLLQNVNGAIELIDSDYSGTTFEIKVYS